MFSLLIFSGDNLGKANGQKNVLGGRMMGFVGFINSAFYLLFSYALFIRHQTTLLIHTAISRISSVIFGFYTQSTGLTITTTYINTNTINNQ